MSLIEGTSVLDIGCAEAPNKLLRDLDVKAVGVDIERFESGVYDEIIQADARDLDKVFPSPCFDSVLMGSMIEHVDHPLHVLTQVRSVLKPGGVLIASTPNPIGLPQLFAEILGLKKYFYTPYHSFAFAPRWFCRLLNLAGFSVERVVGLGLWFLPIPCPTNL